MSKGIVGCLCRLKTKSAVNVLLICGLLTLCIQILIFFLLLYSAENEFNWALHLTSSYFSDPIDDLDIIKQVFTEFGLSSIIVDEKFLEIYDSHKNKQKSVINCDACQFLKYHTLQFAIDKTLEKEVFDAFRNLKFHVIEFKNIKPVIFSKDLSANITTGYILKRYFSFFIVVLHGREDNVLWYGNINSDPKTEEKLAAVGISNSFINHIRSVKQEGVFNRFETTGKELDGTHVDFLFPKNISKFLLDSRSSKYIECNWERAKTFEKIHGRIQNSAARRFRHRTWKLLSRVETVFQTLGITFWLSSGTLLGFTRECSIIPYSKDVDIGVMADSYTDSLQTVMSSYGFRLIIRLGKPEDSFELSFTDQSGIKLDIFFFYRNPNGTVWNGGTQVKSGKKFKYTFPQFDLCWTLFQDLKLRVPCDTERYIEANYGPDWFTPVTEWDWKTSPFNVQPNGAWPKTEWKKAIQVFQ